MSNIKDELNEILEVIKTLKSTTKEIEIVTDLENKVTDLILGLETENPDLDNMSIQEVEAILQRGINEPLTIMKLSIFVSQKTDERQAIMEKAYKILEDVDFRLSEDESDEIVEERMEQINEIMERFAYENGLNYDEDGKFWEPSGC